MTTPVVPVCRLSTPANFTIYQFQNLAEIPPELEWFANLIMPPRGGSASMTSGTLRSSQICASGERFETSPAPMSLRSTAAYLPGTGQRYHRPETHNPLLNLCVLVQAVRRMA
jgi:hypothetical protein